MDQSKNDDGPDMSGAGPTSSNGPTGAVPADADPAVPTSLGPTSVGPTSVGPAEADRTAPDQTAPDQTAPEQVAADETAPDNTAPDQTAPDQVAPDQTAADKVALDETATITPEAVVVRRSPRYFRFMFAGAIVFGVVALILTLAFPAQASFSRMQVFGFLLLAGVVVGIAVGSVVALVVERSGRRSGRKLVADRLQVRASRGDSAATDEASAHNPTNS